MTEHTQVAGLSTDHLSNIESHLDLFHDQADHIYRHDAAL